MRKYRNLLTFDQNVDAVYSNIRAVYPNKNHVTTHPETSTNFVQIIALWLQMAQSWRLNIWHEVVITGWEKWFLPSSLLLYWRGGAGGDEIKICIDFAYF